MYCVLLAQTSIPPAAEVSIPIYTPATDGVVELVTDPVHGMGPHVIRLVVILELVPAREGEAFPFTCIFITHC